MKGRFPQSLVWKDKKGKLSKTRRHGIWSRAEQECFTATFFFVLKCSISKSITLFLGKIFKLVIKGASFITSFENQRVKNDSEQLEIHDSRPTTSRRHLMVMKNDSAEVDKQRLIGTFTQIMYFVRNFSLPLPSLEVPMNFYSNSTYSVMTLLLSPT